MVSSITIGISIIITVRNTIMGKVRCIDEHALFVDSVRLKRKSLIFKRPWADSRRLFFIKIQGLRTRGIKLRSGRRSDAIGSNI